MSAAEHPDTAEAVFYRAIVAANVSYAANVEALRAVYEAARAEGEAAGRAAERAAVVARMRRVTDLAWWEMARSIEAGEHVGAAGTAP